MPLWRYTCPRDPPWDDPSRQVFYGSVSYESGWRFTGSHRRKLPCPSLALFHCPSLPSHALSPVAPSAPKQFCAYPKELGQAVAANAGLVPVRRILLGCMAGRRCRSNLTCSGVCRLALPHSCHLVSYGHGTTATTPHKTPRSWCNVPLITDRRMKVVSSSC